MLPWLSSEAPLTSDVAPAPLRIQEIDRPIELWRLREPWYGLYASSPEATPFQSPEWLLPWAEHIGKGTPWVLGVWRGSTLCGLAPLQIVPTAEGRTLVLLGSPLADHQGILCAPGTAGAGVAAAVIGHVLGERARWDRWDLTGLRPGDPLLAVELPPDLPSATTVADPCPYLPLPPSPQELFAELPDSLGEQLPRLLRRLCQLGEVSFERAEPEAADEMVDALFELAPMRACAQPPLGARWSAAFPSFCREVAAGFLTRDELRLYALRVSGRIEAVVLALAHGRRLYCYLGACNPALGRRSLVTAILWQVMLAAIEEGIVEIDFLRGSEPFKRRFGARTRWNRRRVIAPL